MSKDINVFRTGPQARIIIHVPQISSELFHQNCKQCFHSIHNASSLCLLELLVVKNEVKLEKKQHIENIKASEVFFLAKPKSSKKKHVIFLQFVNIYIISPTTQNFIINLQRHQSSTIRKIICRLFTPLRYIYFLMLFMAVVPYIS